MAKSKGKKKGITQNQAIFIGLGVIAAFVIIQNAMGVKDKDIGLGGAPKS